MKGLTEHEIIRVLTNQFARQPGVPLGFDDDVSAIPFSPKTWIIVQNIARGLGQAAREYHCKIIGGDTNQADDLVIDIVGVGLAKPKELVRRDGARPGDIVAVTGPFGKSSAGLRILKSKQKKDLVKYPSLVRAARRPEARLTQGIILAKSHGTSSSIDSSDGLAWSLHQIADASMVGISLHNIPVAAEVESFAKEHRSSALELALYGGEEYELVVTIKPERFNKLKRRVPSLKKIGIVEKKRFGVSAQIGGKQVTVEARGWQHLT
jgi:thiamine-monophosphate kinase